MRALFFITKIKKSKIFQGHLFTNMVKINLFLANIQSYVPLKLNSAAKNVYIFKLSVAITVELLCMAVWSIWNV